MPDEIPGWPWRPDLCPADLHYGEYLQDDLIHPHPLFQRPPGEITRILHVGTGLHHHIGLLLGARGWYVHGLTVSREEFVVDLTNAPHSYVRQLGDIRDPRLYLGDVVGGLDSMSLFHLGEPPEPVGGMLTPVGVIKRALTWSREVVFYTGSSAWDRVSPLITMLRLEGKMEPTTTYKSLVMFRPTHG